MGESKKKRITYNNDIIDVLIQRFGYTKDYIQKSLRGDRVGIIPDEIKKEYSELLAISQKAISEGLK